MAATVETAEADVLRAAVAEGFSRRVRPVEALAADAEAIARTCLAMARAFQRGGRLLVFGNGASATDAQHISVEFVHPVIVGKRALPAFSLVGDVATVTGRAARQGPDDVFAHQVEVLAKPTDIALGVSPDGDCVNVRRALERARCAGLLTVALVGGVGGAVAHAAEHCLIARADDPRVVKECQVTLYHLLWELVHVFLDHPDPLPSPDRVPGPVRGTLEREAAEPGMAGLYPFLYADDAGVTGSTEALLAEVAASTREKIADIVRLRQAVGEDQGGRLAACAGALATAFAGGGTLLAFGNGGSSTDAQDIAHTFLDPGDGSPGLPALCLTADGAVVTALANDVGFEVVFTRQVRALGRAGDIAVGVSTSGGSANVLAALAEARMVGMTTVGFAGGDGGAMATAKAIDHGFIVPSPSVHRVQEVQTTLYHVMWEAVRALTRRQPAPARRTPPPGRG